MVDNVRKTTTPHHRLHYVGMDMTQAFDASPHRQDRDRCVVFLTDGKEGGIVIHGYDDDAEAITDLVMHLHAMFKARGISLTILRPLLRDDTIGKDN